MTIVKEQLSDLKERYEKAAKLIDEESKLDPSTEPFKSHYAARDILIGMQNNLKNLLSSLDETDIDSILIYKSLLGFIQKDLGRLSIFVEELSIGKGYLQNCIDLLEEYKLKPEAVIAVIDAWNQMGIFLANAGETETAKNILLKAEELYKDFKASQCQPLTIQDLFGTKDEIETGKGDLLLEKTHTLTLYYIAQVMGTLGDLYKSAMYCHTTLRRQLEFNDYEPIDWALNAATLSQYFLSPGGIPNAKHHLAAANFILDKYEKDMIKPEMTEEQRAAQEELFKHRYADVDRCWAMYGLYVLSSSKDRLMEDKDDHPETKDTSDEMKKMKIKNEVEILRFPTLDLSFYENQITDQHVLMYDDAKEVYMNIMTHINRAKEYYTADTQASEYAKIVQDLSSVYKNLAFFEEDDANQCKLHKKRADQLEHLVNILNPTYYLAICREVWYELGLTYATMLDIKLDKLQSTQERPTPHALNKINLLCEKSIKHFQKFVESYYTKDTNELPSDLGTDAMQPILFVYFHLGRLFYKIITPDKRMQLNNVRNSLKYYNLFLEGCNKEKAAGEAMKSEVGVCKEMAKLLPHKIQKLICEIQVE